MTLKVPPLLLMLLVALAMLALRGLWPMTLQGALNLPLAALLAVLGVGVSLAGVWHFKKARTTVNPLQPEAAAHLVTQGVYRFSRNPMYVGFLLMLGAWALVLAQPVNVLWLVFFVLYLNRWQIAPEEQALRGQFGEAFGLYCQQVRRWI